MDFNYSLIKGFCTKFLVKDLRERHLEDLIQYVSMEYWARGCNANLEWLCIDYLRLNGIGKRGKQSAKALENALSIDSSPIEEDEDSNYLIDNVDKEKWTEREAESERRGELEEILSPIFQSKDLFNWAMKRWKPSRRLL